MLMVNNLVAPSTFPNTHGDTCKACSGNALIKNLFVRNGAKHKFGTFQKVTSIVARSDSTLSFTLQTSSNYMHSVV